ncbi:MAG: ATP synthase F1 subunit delta [Candidatus Lambdaproteobacteria bacterium]|nr:ATP synthase F1 subunit delta [Candidatus Lambdaproteobacteria bacterium]
MSTAVISLRYARALMNLAAKAGQVDAVGRGLDDLAGALESSPALTGLLTEPRVSHAQKNEVLGQLLHRLQAPALVTTFVRFVAQQRRTPLLAEIGALYRRLADERQGRAQAEVTVAEPLAAEQQEDLRRRIEALTGKTITLHVQVDPAILGGVVTRIGNTVRDGSLRSQLNHVRQSIREG